MATHTIELREVVSLTNDHIGLDDYPIFDPEYRKVLNDRIKRYFWFNEVAHETIDIFIHQLSLTMDLIMPRYNRMYQAELKNIDALDGGQTESNYGQTGSSKSRGDQSAHNTASSDSKSLGRTTVSDTPQTRLAGNGDYATNISDVIGKNDGSQESNSTTTGQSNSSHENTGYHRSSGYQMPRSQMIALYRSSLVNVDEAIIAELKPLFFGLWDLDKPLTSSGLWGRQYYGYF